ncbi:MAG: pantoate--beta-alanine ligase [Sphingomicrobium sp.]
MQIVRRREDLASACAEARKAGRLGLVPTMGALHAGHLRLVKEARAACKRVAVSIFVNPLQFAAGEDLGRYPRREEEDAALLEGTGCDILWLPSAEDIYPDGFATTVRVVGLSERWEGESRPGHFDGVATVVAKLFNAVAPDAAWFGEKDFQQLAVIRRMVRDLDYPIEIVGVPIVRDTDGLALSSRNVYLSGEQRGLALALPIALEQTRDAILSGADLGPSLAAAKQHLLAAGFLKIDYLALVDAATLEPLDRPAGAMRLIAAATIGSTRLIDNLELRPALIDPR